MKGTEGKIELPDSYRIYFWGDEVEKIDRIDPESGRKIDSEHAITIYPANLFVTGKDQLQTAIEEIQDDMVRQISFFESEGRYIEGKRIQEPGDRREQETEEKQENGMMG